MYTVCFNHRITDNFYPAFTRSYVTFISCNAIFTKSLRRLCLVVKFKMPNVTRLFRSETGSQMMIYVEILYNIMSVRNHILVRQCIFAKNDVTGNDDVVKLSTFSQISHKVSALIIMSFVFIISRIYLFIHSLGIDEFEYMIAVAHFFVFFIKNFNFSKF